MKLYSFNGSLESNKLNHLPFNREFKVRKDLVDSMNITGFITPINVIKTSLITGKEELFIADGQNRAATAAFLNIIYYGVIVEIEFKTIEEIVDYVSRLNSAQKAWVTKNYVESYAYLGMKQYVRLLDMTKKSLYTIDTVASMLYGIRKRGSVRERIMSGKFAINQLKETEYTLKLASKLTKIVHPTSRMVLAIHYVSTLRSFDENSFIKMYTKHAKEIKDLQLDDYTDVFSSWIK